VAESVLVKEQLLILKSFPETLTRSRLRGLAERIVAGVCVPRAPWPADPFRDRPETLNAFEPSNTGGRRGLSSTASHWHAIKNRVC
jgi:hypothetical protein